MTLTEHDVHSAEHPVSGAAAGTREKILALLLRRPDSTAAELAETLELTSAGVRRHLENLAEESLVETLRRPARGRGRPARAWRLTARGRGLRGDSNGQLALDALEALRDAGGSDAVYRFAERRFSAIVEKIAPAEGPEDVQRVAEELAAALTAAGYEATVEDSVAGVQLCQHHCPVWDVAAQCPELCAAEQDVLEVKLGTHVQRLATLAVGNCACTTNIPTAAMHHAAEADPQSAPAARSAAAPARAGEKTNRKDEVQ